MDRNSSKYLKSFSSKLVSNNPKTIGDLSDDELLVIFSYLDLKNQFISRRVCNRWRILIRFVLNIRHSISLVNNDQNVVNWQYEHWYEVVPKPKKYTKIGFRNQSLNSSLKNILTLCPRIRDLDMECYDVNTQTIRMIAMKCPNLERINFDSSNGFNICFSTYLSQNFKRLKILNLSCVSKISEPFVSKLLQSLTQLIALNICGTDVTGHCLSLVPQSLICLNISYCWRLESEGLLALSNANYDSLQELVINNFNFDSDLANECLAAICKKFPKLTLLDMSLGPCTDQTFYLSTLKNEGLSAIGSLSRLEILIIRKICVLDDNSLRLILFRCRLLKKLVIDMFSENRVTDWSVSCLPNCPQLESLEISNNSEISAQTLIEVIKRLPKLNSLVLRFDSNVDNQVVTTAISHCPHLRTLCLNGCQKIDRNSLIAFIGRAKAVPTQKFEFTAIGSGVSAASIRNRSKTTIIFKNIPINVEFKVSTGRTRQFLWYESGRFCYSRNPKGL